MPTDLKPWIEELHKAGSLSDEEKKLLDTVFAKETVAKFVGESVLRQSDYSRKLNEMGEKEKKLAEAVEDKQKALDKLTSDMADWRDKDVLPRVKKLDDELRTAKERLWKHEQAIAKVKSDYNIDPAELGLEAGAPPAKPEIPPAPTLDESLYVKREDYERLLAETQRIPFIETEFQDIADEYQDLFGKPLRGKTALLAEAVAAFRKDPSMKLKNYVEQKFEFQKRREEVAQERQKEHDSKIRAEERAKVLSEYKMPVTRPAPDEMPRLPKPSEVLAKESIGRNRDSQSLAEVVQAYNSGKYKEARPGSA